MSQMNIDKMIHDEGNCDSHSCRYCDQEEDNHLTGRIHDPGCKCRDCLEEKADHRYHEKINEEEEK